MKAKFTIAALIVLGIIMAMALCFVAHANAEPLVTISPGFQMVCGNEKEVIIPFIQSKFEEQPLLEGTLGGSDEKPVTVFANLQTHTWTMVVRLNQETACITFSGKNLAPIAPAARNPPM